MEEATIGILDDNENVAGSNAKDTDNIFSLVDKERGEAGGNTRSGHLGISSMSA
jgi:hypothetical protein